MKHFDIDRAFKLLLPIFFISGGCALSFQMIWLRVLGLVFGNTTLAASTVLASYMAGLGLGAHFFGQKSKLVKNPIKLYGILEAVIGFYGLLTPFLWPLVQKSGLLLNPLLAPLPSGDVLLRFLVSFLFILPPTFLMGGTLPLLSQFATQDHSNPRRVGFLYAVNTLGGVAGVIGTSFISIEKFGMRETILITSGLCVVAALLSLSLSKISPSPSMEQDNSTHPTPSDKKQFLFLILFAVSGAVSMIYEVGWTRVLALVLGSSVYSFAIMLCTFLLGIAIGSYIYSILARAKSENMYCFAVLQALTAMTVLWGLTKFEDMPLFFAQLFHLFGGDVARIELIKFILCFAVMIVPTTLIGAMFPCFISSFCAQRSIGAETGRAYLFNTFGCIIGAFCAGFVLIPIVGVQVAIIAAALTNALIGLVVFVVEMRKNTIRKVAFFLVLLIVTGSAVLFAKPWNKSIMTLGLYMKLDVGKFADKKHYLNQASAISNLYYKDGISSTVSVNQFNDSIFMAVNGKVDASNGIDSFNQFFLGHLPTLLHHKPESVLVIGLGSGMSVSAVASYPVKSIDVVEIEPAVVEASDFFRDLNRNVLSDPRVKVHLDDGRNYLQMNQKKYDVVMSEPSNPWIAGVANLFSLEHYQTVKERLNPGGVVCQWFHIYRMTPEDVRMIVRTFASVFADVSLWVSAYPDVILIGRTAPQAIRMDRIDEYLRNPVIRKDLAIGGIRDAYSLISHYWLGQDEIQQLIKNGRIHSDMYPYLEFSAPRALYQNSAGQNIRFIDLYYKGRYPEMTHVEPPAESNLSFHVSLAKGHIENRMYDKANREILIAKNINPNHADVLFLQGRINLDLGQYKLAEEFLKLAVEKDPNNDETHYYLGLYFKGTYRLAESVSSFKKAIDINPKKAAYWQALGNAYYSMQQYAVSAEIYRRAIDIGGPTYDLVIHWTDSINATGSVDEKIAAHQELLRYYPNTAPAYENLGKLLEISGRLDEASDIYLKFAGLFPSNSAALACLERIQEKKLSLTRNHERISKMIKQIKRKINQQGQIKK